jgi:hypothetical protein
MSEVVVPTAGMTISLRVRRDLVIVDPDRFVAAARDAYCALYPGTSQASATEAIVDVYDAVHALLDRDDMVRAETGDPATQIWPISDQMEVGRGGLRPGSRITDRSDGLSPAGWISHIVLNESQPLQDYGCFLPRDPFALPPDDSDDGG